MSEKKLLRVLDAEQRDVGRGIARIDPRIVNELGLVAGDVVQIIGKKKTSALCWPGHPEDHGKEIIRIDGNIRNNAGVSIDDKVEIKKIEAKKATKITFAPTEPLRIVGGENYLSQILEGRVISRGDTIPINIMGRKIELIASSIQPSAESVIITEDTQVVIGEQLKAPLRAVPRITYEDIGGLRNEISINRVIFRELRHR